jgi:HCOMODA/2-hydroxy-3-carboxy-muconic semialdehyde decarboxylase
MHHSSRQWIEKKRTIVAESSADLRYEIALANRILAHQGVLDAFGHVSARHPSDPKRYLLSRSRAPELVEPNDILEYTLDSKPVEDSDTPLYSERVIHGEIFKARPDVMCVVHHHAPAFMPLVITGIDYTPVFHLGAVGGSRPPFWDQREEFGDTNLLVVKAEEGASLAKRLGQSWMVLMNRHGVTVAGTSVRDAVFRCVFSCLNARFQIEAAAAGKVGPLSPGEIKHAFGISTGTTGQTRSWELWAAQLEKAGGSPPKSASRKAVKPRTPRKATARR